MSGSDADRLAGTGGNPVEVPRAAPRPLGWDEIGAIVILLVAAAHLGSGGLAKRVLWVLIYLAAPTRLVQRFGTDWLRWTLRHQPALSLLLVLAAVSCLWSLTPLVTVQKAASLLGTTMLGVFIGYTCRPESVTRVLHWTFAGLIISSFVAALWVPAPATGAMAAPGWSGIMEYKNSFGALAACATMFFLIVTLKRQTHPIWGVALTGLSLLAVVWARSRTSVIALGVSLVATAYLTIGRTTGPPIAATARRMSLGLVLAVALIPLLLAPLVHVLDPDPLNGRLRLWAGVLTIVSDRPWSGYGYGAVWGWSNPMMLPQVPISGRPWAIHPHNSLMMVASELGIPGVIVACIYLLGALVSAGRLLERAPSSFAVFAFAFLVCLTVMGFAEAHLLRIHSLFWILLVAVTITVQRTLTRDLDPDQPARTGLGR